MISCLPATPGNSWVRRTDWMISRILRSMAVPANADWGRSSARTSCCVIVDAPRELPVRVSRPAERMPAGSKPAFSQNVLSSVDVVASIRTGGIWSYVTTSRCSRAKEASWTLPVRSRTRVSWEKSRLVKSSFGSGRPWL